MHRNYSTGTFNSVTFFTGVEIEKTPAYGKKTLFVVGIQDHTEIINLAKTHECEHIYFGANQSFKTQGNSDFETWISWENMIKHCLKAGFWCTLDLDTADIEGLGEAGLSEYRKFIPQISVKIPYLSLLNYNATVKIDDKDFEATNPGIWCMPLTELTQRRHFTSWDEYSKDEIIK